MNGFAYMSIFIELKIVIKGLIVISLCSSFDTLFTCNKWMIKPVSSWKIMSVKIIRLSALKNTQARSFIFNLLILSNSSS